MDDGEDEREPERRRDRTEHGGDVLVAEQPQEVEVELVRVGKGILDRDRLEERELVAVRVEPVERDGPDLAAPGSRQVAPGVRRDREQPALGTRGVAQVVVRPHRPEERLLDEVLGVARIVREPEAEAVQAVEMVAGDVGERRALGRLERRRGRGAPARVALVSTAIATAPSCFGCLAEAQFASHVS